MSINTFPQDGVLTDAELDRLAEFLSKSKGRQAMNIEELDGFFAALIAGPDVVPPSEYLPEVFGGEMSDTCEFAGLDEANEILGLIMQHWNGIAATLHKGNVYLPVLLDDDDGVCRGNDWSRGYMRGVEKRRESWAELILDEEQGRWIIPVLMLYHEHDGMGHCGGGPGPNIFDAVSALDQWVERGKAPEAIIASHVAKGVTDRTRPLCPYPQLAKWKGSGSIDEAANFACADPSRLP